MSFLATEPQVIAAAAADLAQIRSTMGAANAAAAAPTGGVVAAAADEVSAATATLFNTYAQEYQAVISQVSSFHDQFTQLLAGSGLAYLEAEAANAIAAGSGGLGGTSAPLQGVVGGAPAATAVSSALGAISTPIQSLLNGTAVSGALGGLNAPIQSLLAATGLTATPTGSAGRVVTPPTPATPSVDPVALVMGGSGLPIPPPSYVSQVSKYISPSFGVTSTQALFTPEGLYPLTGVKSLPLNTSVSEGVQILDSAIKQQITLGNDVSVLGYSQSAIISSIEMQNLAAAGNPYQGHLSFTLLGDPMNPNGGLFERFAGLTLPSLGLDFYGATPSNTPYPTNIFTLQYDGYADFPKYPVDFLADLNAFAGIYFVHGTYPMIDPSHLPAGYNMLQLATSPGYSGATNYYMITEPNLPLLDPVRAIPVIGNPIADLLQPDLTYLVNWGYGDPAYGYSTGPANVPTPFGVIPPLSATTVLPGDLAMGTQQGINAFVSDISAGSSGLSLSSVPTTLTSLFGSGGGTGGGPGLLPTGLPSALSSPDSFIQALQTANTTVTNFITNAAAQSYAVLLPTADIANALVTSVPSYDVNLFLSGVEQAINGDPIGGLIYAFGAPVAADVAVGTLAGGFELEVLLDAATSII